MPFVVPESLRKDLSPRRSIPGSAVMPTEAAARRLLSKVRHSVAEKNVFGDRTHGNIYRAGLAAQTVGELDVLGKAAVAFVLAPSIDALRSAELDTLAVAEHLIQRADHGLAFLSAVVALRGLADGVHVFHRSSFFALTAGSGGYTTAVWIARRAGALDHSWPARWLPLRHAVCASNESEYAEAVSVARSLREGQDLLRRARMAFVFPDEPWANEDLESAQLSDPKSPCTFLLSAATSVDLVREEARRTVHAVATHALDLGVVLPTDDMIALCSEVLPGLLKKPAYGPLHKTPPRSVASALACIRTKEAAAILAPYATNAILAPIVLGYFRDAPELAASVPQGKGATAVSRVVAKTVAPKDARVAGEAPNVLVDRPWRPKKRKKVSANAIEVDVLGVDEEKVVPTNASSSSGMARCLVRDMTAEEHATWKKETEEGIAKRGYACADFAVSRGTGPTGGYEYLRVPDEDVLWAWNTGKTSLQETPFELVERHGLSVLPGFLKLDWLRWLGAYDGGEAYMHAAMTLVSPRMAPRIARVAARRKKYRRVALGWLAEHVETAALGLVPDAVGPAGEARDDAESALLFLASRGQENAVMDAARRYGAEVSKVVEEVLARDPLALDVAPPKRPDFLRLGELPPVNLVSGGALDADARDALVEMLQISPLEPPYAGIALVREACEPESLSGFAIELVEQWVLGDAPGRHEWMLFAAVHLCSEASVRRVASLTREWARKHQEKAKRGCVALAAIGSDLALMHLAHVADTTRFDALRKHASALVLEAAESRGLTPEELGDRTVPDVGLDRDGTMTLSYGARRFVVSLDETLRPVVSLLVDGKPASPSHSLPRPSKSDDAEAVKVAREQFERLRADLEAVADRERHRLESAMANGRSWTVTEFRTFFVDHPLLVHVSRRLVWVVTHDGGSRAFRVAEDRTFADANDATFALVDGTVRMAHPASDPDLVDVWSRLFADYEILQPFEQLARAIATIESSERGAKDLSRVADIVVPARKTMGILESRGYRREDPGYVGAFVRNLRARDGSVCTVRLPLSPGFDIEGLSSAKDQTTQPATLVDSKGGQAAFGVLDAVSFSELVRDAEALRSR